MNIKSSKELVDGALKEIKTLEPKEVKDLDNVNQCTLIDIRDIRELLRDGTIKGSHHIPRGMLEFWLDPQSQYYDSSKFSEKKKINPFLCSWHEVCFGNKNT